MDDIPEGFDLLDRKSPFMEPIGPVYRKIADRSLSIGVRIAERHTNARGLVHGGLIATLADIGLGYVLMIGDDPPKSAVTVNLTTDLFGAASIGDWLEVRAEAKRVGGTLAFSACDVLADGAPIAHATGVYRLSR